jgi:hypothetical protein
LAWRIDPKKYTLPVYFHNLKGYDSHLIISAAQERHGRIRVVPATTEKYIGTSA